MPGSNFDYIQLKCKNSKSPPEDIVKIIRESEAMQKAIRIITPLAPFHKNKDWELGLQNWKFLYAQNQGNWFFVGDNPIITPGINDHNPVNCLKKFIFPISGKVLLIKNKANIKNEFPPSFIIKYNTAIIERSKRFVASSNKELLKALVNRYKIFLRYGKTSMIIPELFESLI